MSRWWCSTAVAEGCWLVSHQEAPTAEDARALHAQTYRKRYPSMDPATSVKEVRGVSAAGYPVPLDEAAGAPA